MALQISLTCLWPFYSSLINNIPRSKGKKLECVQESETESQINGVSERLEALAISPVKPMRQKRRKSVKQRSKSSKTLTKKKSSETFQTLSQTRTTKSFEWSSDLASSVTETKTGTYKLGYDTNFDVPTSILASSSSNYKTGKLPYIKYDIIFNPYSDLAHII